jgi:hypothetical protein
VYCTGAVVTVKLDELVAVPAAFVTLIGPLVAPSGTFARSCVSESTVKALAAVPLKVTLVVPLNPLPVRVTSVPTGPLVGLNEAICGVTITTKSLALLAVPSAFVTLIGPVLAPLGTTAVICVFETTLKPLAGIPLNATAVVPLKLLPLIVMLVPAIPWMGLNEVMTGALLEPRLI